MYILLYMCLLACWYIRTMYAYMHMYIYIYVISCVYVNVVKCNSVYAYNNYSIMILDFHKYAIININISVTIHMYL